MGTRHDARRWAVQLLFQQDFQAAPLDEALAYFWEQNEAPADAKAFAEELVRGVLEHGRSLDRSLQTYAENWDLHRMSGVDRNILRLALYEMVHRKDIPPVVSINEAVEIAKEFGGPEAGGFVNGILDRARKDVHRPARTTTETPQLPSKGREEA